MDDAAAFLKIVIDWPLLGLVLAVQVPDDGMVGCGILPSDKVLVQKQRSDEIEAGKPVVFRLDGKARIGELHPPFILFHPPADKAASPDYQPLRASTVEIYGRVIRLIRDL